MRDLHDMATEQYLASYALFQRAHSLGPGAEQRAELLRECEMRHGVAADLHRMADETSEVSR